jgi:hypothetical protein
MNAMSQPDAWDHCTLETESAIGRKVIEKLK